MKRDPGSLIAPARRFAGRAALAAGWLALAWPQGVRAADAQAVTVQGNPLIVYTVVGLLAGAVVAALVFAVSLSGGRDPRPGAPLAARRAGLPWMPGGDIFGEHEEALLAQVSAPPAVEPAPPEQSPWLPAHDPWSTGEPGAGPRWGAGPRR